MLLPYVCMSVCYIEYGFNVFSSVWIPVTGPEKEDNPLHNVGKKDLNHVKPVFKQVT